MGTATIRNLGHLYLSISNTKNNTAIIPVLDPVQNNKRQKIIYNPYTSLPYHL